MKIKKTSLALFFMMLLFPTQTFGNRCRPHLRNASIIVIPENIVALETSLLELNNEFQRLDLHHDNKALTDDELDEITSQEITVYKHESDIRLIYISRLKALRIKIVEKLVDLYLKLYQRELVKADISTEEARKLLYSIVEFTKIRQFYADKLSILLRLSKSCALQIKMKNKIEDLYSILSQLERTLEENDHSYAQTLMFRLSNTHRMKIVIPTKASLILKAAKETHIALLDTIEKTVDAMEQRNDEILNDLANFPEYDFHFDLDSFSIWAAQSKSDRRFLDSLITLEESFVTDKNRVPGCCGRPCGLTCPYLTSMMIPIPTLDKIPAHPKMAVYRTLLVFQKMVADSIVPYPAKPSILRQQLRDIISTPQ